MTAVPRASLTPLQAGPLQQRGARRLGGLQALGVRAPRSGTEARSKQAHLAWTAAQKSAVQRPSTGWGLVITLSQLVSFWVLAYSRNQSDAEHPTLHLPLKLRQPARISPCEAAIGRCG